MTALLENCPPDETTGPAEAPETAAPVAPNTMLARDLHHAVADAIHFAAAVADNVPAIAVVHLEARSDHMVAVATNRYVLGATKVAYAGAVFSLDVGVDDAKVLARMAKTAKRDEKWREVQITVADAEVTFRFTSGEALTVRDADVSFPTWRRLLPSSDDRMGKVAGVGVNPIMLARFAKVHNEGARMSLFPTATPDGTKTGLTVVQIGDHFTGLIMPWRSPDGVESYTLPDWVAAQ